MATYARCGHCGGIFNNGFTAKLPRNLQVKKNENRLRFDRIVVMSLWSDFLAHPVKIFYAYLLTGDNGTLSRAPSNSACQGARCRTLLLCRERCDTKCCSNVRSKADVRVGKQSGDSVE